MSTGPKPVPNICAATGVSYDFRLAYRTLTHYLERVEAAEPARTRFLALRSLLHRPVARYEEYFEPAQHLDVVTPANAAAVERINSLVDRLNALRESATSDYDTLAALRADLEAAVSGNSVPSDGEMR